MGSLKTTSQALEIIDILAETHPEPETELNYETPFELLIAVILSAQTTDKQVNKVTKNLFEEFKKPEDISNLEPVEFEPYIQGLGLYRNKSKYIVKTCNLLVEEYDSKVPDTREELMKLSGVGRKTANVVLSSIYGEDTIAVDTHVFRVSNRLGFVNNDKVGAVEEGLMELLPQEKWSAAHHWLIFHGRTFCKARNPKCKECPVNNYCNYYSKSSS